MIARHVGAEVDDEVAEVVLLTGADGAVGEEHERLATDEAGNGVIGVDPGVDAGRRVQLRARGPELDDGVLAASAFCPAPASPTPASGTASPASVASVVAPASATGTTGTTEAGVTDGGTGSTGRAALASALASASATAWRLL